MTFSNSNEAKCTSRGGGGNLSKRFSQCLHRGKWGMLVFLLLFSGNFSLAAEYQWNGNNGLWSDATQWTPGGNPTSGDTVTINAGKVTTATQSLSNFTLYLKGGELEMNSNDFTLYNNTHVYQTGGTFSLTQSTNCWLNIGENQGASSSYTISGGKLDLISTGNSNLVVGRRGEGHFTMEGENTVVNTKTFVLGYFSQLSGNSSVQLKGGTLTVAGNSRIGGSANEDRTYVQTGTKTFTINGGTYNSLGEVSIGNYVANLNNIEGGSVNTLFQLQSGTWNANAKVLIGTGNITKEGNSNNVQVNISGGEATFNQNVQLGAGVGANAAMTLSGGTAFFLKELQIGVANNSTVNMNLQDNAVATMSGLVQIGIGSGTNANMNISGGRTSFLGEVQVGIGTGTAANINISGGMTNFKGLSKIGTVSGVTGNVNISGGDVEFTKAVLLGAGGDGVMKISGGITNFNIDWSEPDGATFRIGAVANSSGRLEISGIANVSFTGNDIHVGNGGAGSIVQTGGTFTASGWLNIGEGSAGTYTLSGGTLKSTGKLVIGRRGQGTMTVSDDGIVDAQSIFVGYFPQMSGNSVFQVDGGTVTGTQLFVGNQGENATGTPTGISTVNITGGTTTFSGWSYIGHAGTQKLGGKGVLNVTGGSIRFNARTAVGYDLNGEGTVQITGGTVYGPNADFLLGEGNSLGKMTVDGGAYGSSTNLPYNLVIWSTTAVDEDGNMGSRLELKSGSIHTQWLSLGQGGVAGGTCTFDMTGGTLHVGTGSQQFRIGLQHHGTANISGGDITVNGTLSMATNIHGGELNVYGSDSTWDVKAVDWRATGTANFVAKALTFQDDGTAKAAISTIKTRENATIASHIGVDMSDYYYTGVGFLTNLPTPQLLTAQSLTWNPASVTVKGDWALTTENNTVGLTLDETKIAMADVTSGSGIASGVLGTRGWVQILGEADSIASILLFYKGEGDGDMLAEWLTDQLDETQQDITITNTGSFIEFGNLLLNADGMGYLSYNIDAFNTAFDMNLTFANVPEPSTWGLMLLGLAFIFWKRGFWRKS